MKENEQKGIFIHEDENEIPEGFYKNNKDLTSIIIPDSVSKIGAEAFLGCENLTSIKLPKNLKKINNNTFENCTSLKKIEIPFGVTEIGEDAFLGCHNLEDIKLPESVVSIGDSAFEGCLDKKLDKLVIPSSVKSIGNNAFSNCTGLDEVVINEGVNKIGDRCFENCSDLKEVHLPDTIYRISEGLFKNCSSLKEIRFPQNLRFIESGAFQDCNSLRTVEIPDSVLEIKDGAFSNCIGLKSIKLPENIIKINRFAFDFCIALKSVEIPKNVTKIGEFAFSNCLYLREVTLPDSLKEIEESAFKNTDITEIVIPDSVERIGMHAFRNCKKLESLTLPKNLQVIEPHSFSDCTVLTSVTIPEGVKKIKTLAFVDCSSLEEVVLPSSLEEVETDAFLDCAALQQIFIPDRIKKLGSINRNMPFFFTKKEDGFMLSLNPMENSISTSLINLDLPFLSRAWKNKDVLLREQRNPFIARFYNDFLRTLPEADASYFIENHNFTFFKQLKLDNEQEYSTLYKLLYNLGGLSAPIQVDEKKVDYAQKVVGLILDKIAKGETTIEELNNIDVSLMENRGYNKEFTDFFLKNFDEIIQEERSNEGFISRCYNEFETVQKTNTSNHGSQRRLKPTVKKFIQYFDDNKFTGITPETKHIADAISPYFSEQELFDEAVKIFGEKNQLNVPDNILKTRLKETDVFTQIDNYAQNINSSAQNTLSILTELAKKEFTYEWLEKNDPENFILGKLCSCCSHLDGSGYGIMKASIVDPNVQTLVIRNKNGDIIAKSTLFINPDERYGVFNNVEISEDVKDADKEKIYTKYMMGIKKFAEEYNKEHPDKTLKSINVGMHYNDLQSQIYSNCYQSEKLLKSIDYGKVYGKDKQNYNGDSHSIQFVLWENDEPQL